MANNSLRPASSPQEMLEREFLSQKVWTMLALPGQYFGCHFSTLPHPDTSLTVNNVVLGCHGFLTITTVWEVIIH